MRKNCGERGPAETTLIIQSAIMGLDPQQLLLRDRLAVFMSEPEWAFVQS